MERRILFIITLAALSLIGMTACGMAQSILPGAAQPVGIDDLAVYPGTTLVKPGQNPIADQAAKNSQQAAPAGGKREDRVFALSKDVTWNQVMSFYNDKLKGAGWQSLNLVPNDQGIAKVATWLRGLGAGRQSIVVTELDLSQVNQGTFLMLTLITYTS